MSTSMSYWPLELYQFDALRQLFGPTEVQKSPLNRAYSLHDQNIKEGLDQFKKAQEQREQREQRPHTSSGRDGNDTRESGNETGGSEDDSYADASTPPSSYVTLEYNQQQLDNLRDASTEIRQNLLRLNVYLEDLSVVKFKQMPAYGMEDLFADIGGTLGLWMGVSVLTMLELLELVVRLTHLFLRAEWKPGEEVVDKAPAGDERAAAEAGGGAPAGDGRYARDYVSTHASAQCDVVHADENDYYRSPGLWPRQNVDTNDRGPMPFENLRSGYTTTYSGNTKYWRLKRGKKR